MAIGNLTIAVDFDGTCVTHEYPHIGLDIGAEEVLRELAVNGNKLILFTMRSGKLEKEAVEWFKARGIPLYAVNENPDQKKWSKSPKVYADYYIDDSALGSPLKCGHGASRPFIDWEQVRAILRRDGLLD